eukprot:7705013-Pyramimonas_sp.AAC.2
MPPEGMPSGARFTFDPLHLMVCCSAHSPIVLPSPTSQLGTDSMDICECQWGVVAIVLGFRAQTLSRTPIHHSRE